MSTQDIESRPSPTAPSVPAAPGREKVNTVYLVRGTCHPGPRAVRVRENLHLSTRFGARVTEREP